MSYDIKLTRACNHKTIEEDQIIDVDGITVILNKPLNNTSNVVVRINDFRRSINFKTEIVVREDVSEQFTVSNKDTIYVKKAPIYDGLKVGNLATYKEDVFIKIFVIEEDVTGQLTGMENFFYLEGHPILKYNDYDFNSIITKTDIVVIKNGTAINHQDITDINSTTGRIQLTFIPTITDVIKVTYCFRAKIKILDSENGRIVLKEKPKIGQKVLVQYYANINDGWQLIKSKRSTYKSAMDVSFFLGKNTNRNLIVQESLMSQVTGTTSTFQLQHYPLLPLYQDFTKDSGDTLNNALSITVNGTVVIIERIDAEKGQIRISYTPQIGDIVLATYFDESEAVPDRISIDYAVDLTNCSKCAGNSGLAEYKTDTLGNYEKVEREDKLIQDLKKIIVTRKGSDPVATWYGTNFESFIGTKQLPDYVKTRISGEIVEALNRLKNAQIQQEEYQNLTTNEFLDYIEKITV
jgi:hypothetical protein